TFPCNCQRRRNRNFSDSEWENKYPSSRKTDAYSSPIGHPFPLHLPQVAPTAPSFDLHHPHSPFPSTFSVRSRISDPYSSSLDRTERALGTHLDPTTLLDASLVGCAAFDKEPIELFCATSDPGVVTTQGALYIYQAPSI
ncbi:hypothetical protein CH063_09028, partial [Colletotrichum higginsianum]